jgi:ABC-2 type transport system permease protein
LLVKYGGAAVFVVVAPLVVALTGAGIGAALFPVGPVTLLSGDRIGTGEALVRLLLIAAYLAVSLLGLSAIGLFISTLTDVPVGAMAATVVLSVVSQVLDALPQLEWLHPWLFSHYWLDFGDLLRQPVSWESFAANAVLQGGYVAVVGALAYGRFITKDGLSYPRNRLGNPEAADPKPADQKTGISSAPRSRRAASRTWRQHRSP